MADAHFKYPWEGRTARNTGPSMRLGPLQAPRAKKQSCLLCWQSKPTKPSSVRRQHTSAEPAVPPKPSCVPTEGPPDAPAPHLRATLSAYPPHLRATSDRGRRGSERNIWSRPTMTSQVSQPRLVRAELCNQLEKQSTGIPQLRVELELLQIHPVQQFTSEDRKPCGEGARVNMCLGKHCHRAGEQDWEHWRPRQISHWQQRRPPVYGAPCLLNLACFSRAQGQGGAGLTLSLPRSPRPEPEPRDSELNRPAPRLEHAV